MNAPANITLGQIYRSIKVPAVALAISLALWYAYRSYCLAYVASKDIHYWIDQNNDDPDNEPHTTPPHPFSPWTKPYPGPNV
jgi:hypothetical protein